MDIPLFKLKRQKQPKKKKRKKNESGTKSLTKILHQPIPQSAALQILARPQTFF